MSMLTEASCMRRPVHVFDMRDTADDGDRSGGTDGLSTRLRRLGNALRYRALTHHLAQRFGPRRMRRDVGRLHAALIRSGRAVYLGQPFPERPPPPLPDASEVTDRVLALLAADTGDQGTAG
jgi:hypothetical protein